MLFLDLDRFKLLNDSYGHHMGDKLLEAVAARLSHISKEQHTISRFGGDEFVIVLPLLDKDQLKASEKAQQHADRVIKEISSVMHLKSSVQDVEIEYSITGSVGGG